MSGPFSFDDEYDTGEDEAEEGPQGDSSPASAAADQIVANLAGPVSAEQDEDELDESYMDDVDERIEVAIYYRQLLKGPLFDVDTKETRIVEREVRRFVRNRAKELVGLAGPGAPLVPPPAPVPLPFSQEEITALKLLAARLMAAPAAATPAPEKKAEPQVRRAAAPESKAPQTAPRRVSQQPVKPAPVAAPAAPPPPAAAPATPPPAGKGGRKRGFQKKQAVDRDGNPVFNEDGKPVMITKVEQQNPSGRLPWPSDNQLTAITESQAHTRTGGAIGTVGPGAINVAAVTANLVATALKTP